MFRNGTEIGGFTTDSAQATFYSKDALRFSAGASPSLEKMRINSDGNVLIGTTSNGAKLVVDQASATGAIPVLKLTQADLSEELIKFDATIGIGNPIEVVAAKTLTPTHFLRFNIEGVGDIYIQGGTIA